MADISSLWGLSEETFSGLVVGLLPRLAAGQKVAASAEAERQPQLLAAEGSRRDGLITRETEIAAPLPVVWSWLSQVMRGGGVYGWPTLESTRQPSAEYLIEDLAPPAPGDQLDGCLRISRVIPGRELLWNGLPDLTVLGLPLVDLAISYSLAQVDRTGRILGNSPETTRLVSRLLACCRAGTTQVNSMTAGVLDFVLARHQLKRLKFCIESGQSLEKLGRSAAWRCVSATGAPHQLAPFVPSVSKPPALLSQRAALREPA